MTAGFVPPHRPGNRPAARPASMQASLVGVEEVASACRPLCARTPPFLPSRQELLRQSRFLFQDWTLEIGHLLHQHGVLRFTEIMRLLPGMSSRTLSLRLAGLQRIGFLGRTFHDEHPPRAEYRLTDSGTTWVVLTIPLLLHVAAHPDEAEAPEGAAARL